MSKAMNDADPPARRGTGKAPPQLIHREQIENVVGRLVKAADKLKEIAVDMDKQRVEAYDVTNYPTMLTGLKQIEAFKNAAESAWDDYKFDRVAKPANGAGESAQMQKRSRTKPAKPT